jgi:hypothetical protein
MENREVHTDLKNHWKTFIKVHTKKNRHYMQFFNSPYSVQKLLDLTFLYTFLQRDNLHLHLFFHEGPADILEIFM